MVSSASLTGRRRVAVIGLGLSGLAALKNFLEQGFDVTAYERNQDLGGIWRWRDDPSQTTVLKTTISNTPKSYSCYQDFPFPSNFPEFPSAGQVLDYLERYAEHFDLLHHCRFGLKVESLKRSEDGHRWEIHWSKGQEDGIDVYDRVLVATGPYGKPLTPNVPGRDAFRGTVIHAQAYKGPPIFADKRVLVVGMSNSGCDIAVDLVNRSSKVYLSHRNGARIIKRYYKDRPLHDGLTRRRQAIKGWIGSAYPVQERALEKMMHDLWDPLDPGWRLLPAPPDVNTNAVINDDIIPALRAASIISVSGVKAITPIGVVTDHDGEIEVDAVIFCTGYSFDYSILSPEADPTQRPTSEWDASPHSNGLPYPWLYQTIFSMTYPQSLAFIGPCEGYTFAAFVHADLATQAIARVWAGAHLLPSTDEMEQWCEDNYRSSLKRIEKYRCPKTGSDGTKLQSWLCAAAGNRVKEKLGWGLQGWKFWWTQTELYRLMVDGIDTPFVYRLFDGASGSRSVWKDARDAIYGANATRR